MKRTFFYIIFFFASTLTIHSQTEIIHSFNIWGQGGYSNLFVKSDGTTNKGGIGGILGLGYGYKYNHFILEVGFEFDYKSSLSKYRNYTTQVGKFIDKNTGEEIPLGTTITSEIHPVVIGGFSTDNPESKFVMQYIFTDLQDLYKIGYINMPLRVGGTFNGFYFLVGPKIGLNVLSYAETSGNHSALGYFPQDIGYLSDMPNHAFVNNQKTSGITRFNGKLNFNLAASVEVGINFIWSNTNVLLHELRLAFFADYGILNINSSNYISTTNTNGNVIYIPATEHPGIDPSTVKYNSLLTSNIKPKANPFIAGVKLTLLFSSKRNCYSSRPTEWWVVGARNGYRR